MEGAVQDPYLIHENAERPAVEDNVVHGELQYVFACTHSHHFHAQQRTSRQIERQGPFLVNKAPYLLFSQQFIDTGEIMECNRQCVVLKDALDGTVLPEFENSAQHFMPPHNLVQTVLKRWEIKVSLYTKGDGGVIDTGSRIHLLQKPYP